MNNKTIPFRLASTAGPFRCTDGEIESSVNARLIAVSTSAAAALPDTDGNPNDTDLPDADKWKETVADLNLLSSSLLPIVEFTLSPAPLPGWQNHPDNPISITVEAPKSKDSEGWKTRASETLSLFHETASRQHLYTEPFLAISALRLTDGSHILPSAPVLLLPSTSAPHIEGSDNFSLDTMTMTIFASCSRLRCHISVPLLLREWSDRIEALDIFTSDPIPLYHHSSPLQAVHRAAGSTQPQSWLPDSLSDSEFTASLLSTTVFYPISTISLKELFPESATPISTEDEDDAATGDTLISGDSDLITGEYQDINFNIPSFSIASSLPILKAMMNYTPDYLQHRGIESASAISMSGRLTLADLTLTLPLPPSLASLMPRSATTSQSGASQGVIQADLQTDTSQAIMQVESVKNGEVLYSLRYDPRLPDVCLSEADFPKWLFIPDPDARRLSITTSDATYIVPLRRHPLLNGTFYWGGTLGYKELSATEVRKLSTQTIFPTTPYIRRDSYRLPDAIWRSAKNQPLLFPDSLLMRPDVGRVIGICRAFRASGLVATTSPTAYLFTDEGIFLLKEMDNGELRDAGLISCHILSSPESIRVVGRTLYFTAEDGTAMTISGTTVKAFSSPTSGSSADVSSVKMSEVMITPVDPSLPIKVATRPLKLSSILPDTSGSFNCNGAYSSVSRLAESIILIRLMGAYTSTAGLSFYVSHDLIHWQLLTRGKRGLIAVPLSSGMVPLSAEIAAPSYVGDLPPATSPCYGRLEISGCISGSLEALRITYSS
ncbi:MAG: hypothetical protein HDS35_12695 [Bacteroides sp.]|nr:hypothetical protein [Bacteroides sp.]